jgi:hypothetical protein
VSSSNSGPRDTWWPRPKPRPTSTPQIADQTTVRPPSTLHDDTSAATRSPHHVTSHPNSPRTGSAEDLRVSPKTWLGPLPVAGPTGEPDGRSREHPQRRPLLFWKRKALTVRLAACYGARRCCHRHVVPAGQPASQAMRPRSTPASTRGRSPSLPRVGARPRSTAPKRCRPAARSAVRSDDTNPSKPGNLPSNSSRSRLSPPRSTAPAPGFWPFAGSALPVDEQVGSARGPSPAVFDPKRALRNVVCSGAHREVDTSAPTPKRRDG